MLQEQRDDDSGFPGTRVGMWLRMPGLSLAKTRATKSVFATHGRFPRLALPRRHCRSACPSLSSESRKAALSTCDSSRDCLPFRTPDFSDTFEGNLHALARGVAGRRFIARNDAVRTGLAGTTAALPTRPLALWPGERLPRPGTTHRRYLAGHRAIARRYAAAFPCPACTE
jgi:hypothetical protein